MNSAVQLELCPFIHTSSPCSVIYCSAGLFGGWQCRIPACCLLVSLGFFRFVLFGFVWFGLVFKEPDSISHETILGMHGLIITH